MSGDLKTNCHVAIYGVLFDFNKSTLQPASDPVLQQILDLLKKIPRRRSRSRDTRTTWGPMPTTRRCLKRAPGLSIPGSHSTGSPATGLQPKALARPGRLPTTQRTRAERRIGASRLPTRIAPHIRSSSTKCAPVTFHSNSLAWGVHAQFWLWARTHRSRRFYFRFRYEFPFELGDCREDVRQDFACQDRIRRYRDLARWR